MSEPDDSVPGEECGYTYDHSEEVTYEGEDGTGFYCTECGAEWFEDAE